MKKILKNCKYIIYQKSIKLTLLKTDTLLRPSQEGNIGVSFNEFCSIGKIMNYHIKKTRFSVKIHQIGDLLKYCNDVLVPAYCFNTRKNFSFHVLKHSPTTSRNITYFIGQFIFINSGNRVSTSN